MKSMSAMRPNRHQHGFSIVSAIFLVVVLSALGAFMLTFSNVQQMTSTQDIQGAKAYQAARAGMEWGAYQIIILNTGCNGFPINNNLLGFSVVVTCMPSGPYIEGGNTINLYQITATATTGTVGSTTYTERQLQATLEK